MPRKGENIYKRKDGRWEGRYKKGRKPNGRLTYGYIYGKTYTEVKHSLYYYKLKYQHLIEVHGESTLLYEEWGKIWLNQKQNSIKASTYSTYLYKMQKYIFPIIGKNYLNQLKPHSIQLLIDEWRTKGLSATTINDLFQIVKKTLKDAFLQEHILQTPCVNILLPKKKKSMAQALTKTEQERLEKEVKQLPAHKGLPVLLSLHTGMRIGEIAALRWEDIDFNNQLIHVKKTFQRLPIGLEEQRTQLHFDYPKTESSNRYIPIDFTLLKYLKKFKRKAIGPYVCSNKLLPMEPRLITYYFHNIRKDCDLTSIHFHQLRHTFATRCIETNADIASVSRLLGHTSTKTTLDIYTDSLLETRRIVINTMNKSLY